MKRHSGRIASLFVILFFGVFVSSVFAAIETGSNDETGISIVATGQAAMDKGQLLLADLSVQQDMTVFSDPKDDDEEEDDEDEDDKEK
jgi:hypothetical protein